MLTQQLCFMSLVEMVRIHRQHTVFRLWLFCALWNARQLRPQTWTGRSHLSRRFIFLSNKNRLWVEWILLSAMMTKIEDVQGKKTGNNAPSNPLTIGRWASWISALALLKQSFRVVSFLSAFLSLRYLIPLYHVNPRHAQDTARNQCNPLVASGAALPDYISLCSLHFTS